MSSNRFVFNSFRFVVPFLVGALLIACASEPEQPPPRWKSVSGTVVYRERMMLPPDSQVNVQLQDVSRMDVAATVLGESNFPARGGPPYSFELKYDPDRMEAGGRYALRASIRHYKELLFTTTEHVDPFSLAGADVSAGASGVELLVRRVGGENSEASLVSRDWRLQKLEGAELSGLQRFPSLKLDPASRQATGSTGCNRYFASYTLSESALRLGQAGVTQMACVNGMEAERAFMAMLEQVRAWEVSDGELILRDGDDGELARFRSATGL